MKHIKNVERRLSDTKFYLYIAGAIIKLLSLLKSGGKAILRHLIEIFLVIVVISEYVVAQAFGDGAINFVAAMIFIAILGVLAITLIQIKIFKDGGEK